MIRRILLALTAALITVGAVAVPPAQTADSSIKILSIGDSITHGGNASGYGPAYRTELSRLLGLAGIAHTYETSAWPGQSCGFIASQMPSQLAAYNPDLVLLNCGTNDSPGTTETPYRAMLQRFTTTGTPAVASWIGYADPRIAPQASWLLPNQRAANDGIYRALFGPPVYYGPTIGVADMQAIPGDAEFLVPSNSAGPDGIHPSTRGYVAMARLFYKAAAVIMGWPSLATLGVPEMCGLRGNWRDYPEPLPGIDYVECTS